MVTMQTDNPSNNISSCIYYAFLFGDSSNVTPTRKPLFNPPSDYVDNDDLNIPAYWTRNKEFGKTIDLTDK